MFITLTETKTREIHNSNNTAHSFSHPHRSRRFDGERFIG